MARKQLVDIDMNGRKVTNLPTPTASGDAVPKSYVDALPTGGGDVVSDTSPQLGGDLDSNSHNILMADANYVQFGSGNMRVYGDTGTIGQGALLFTGTNPDWQRSLYFSGPVSLYAMAGATGTGASTPEITMLDTDISLKFNGVTNSTISLQSDNGVRLNTNGQWGTLQTENLTNSRTYQLPDADGTLALLSNITGGSGSLNLPPIEKTTDFVASIDGKHYVNVRTLDATSITVDMPTMTSDDIGKTLLFTNTSPSGSALYIRDWENESQLSSNTWGVEPNEALLLIAHKTSFPSRWLPVYIRDYTSEIQAVVTSVTGLVPYSGATQSVNLNGQQLTGVGAVAGPINAGLQLQSASAQAADEGGQHIQIDAGLGAGTGIGGDVSLTGGNTTSGAPGNIVLKPGNATEGGIGAVRITNSQSGHSANLYTNGLTAARDYQLPNASGTLALVSDIPDTSSYITASSTDTVSNKTLNNTNIATLRSDRFTLQDATDNTKQATFVLSGITTGVTRAISIPNGNTTLVGTTTTQTVTNKTLDASTVLFADTTDATKKAQFILSGFATGATRQFSLPNYNGVLATVAGTETFTNKTMSGASNTFSNISADSTIDGTTNKVYTATEKTKLSGVETGAQVNTFARVIHGSNAATARPSATHVEWVGSVAPTNANTTNDTWVDTA